MQRPVADSCWRADLFSKRHSPLSGPVLAAKGAISQQDCKGILHPIRRLRPVQRQ